jgi:hypothetical protein
MTSDKNYKFKITNTGSKKDWSLSASIALFLDNGAVALPWTPFVACGTDYDFISGLQNGDENTYLRIYCNDGVQIKYSGVYFRFENNNSVHIKIDPQYHGQGIRCSVDVFNS